MAHNKLYRNFIILQEDEKIHSSNEKSLSGYAKIEAKGDKCKISFYAQNLKKSDNYSIVLICCKKDMKQIIDMGPLMISESGKGEACKEYPSENIAGLGMSYDKISGAGICKKGSDKAIFMLYGFMNGEKPKDGWKSSKVVKCNEDESSSKAKKYIKDNKDNDEKKIEYKEDNKYDEEKKIECKKDDKDKDEKKIECKKDEKHEEKKKEDSDCKYDKDDECKDKKDYDHKDHDKDKEDHDHKDKEDHDHKDKKDCDDKDKKYIKEKHEDGCSCAYDYGSKKREEFEDYERKIEEVVDPYDFKIRGGIGEFFEGIVKGFEEVKDCFKEITYCKWYKVPIRSIDDMCDATEYDKYTVMYYPMINYYPYIMKHGYFMMGYKCDNKGKLKYIVYAIPGMKDKYDQPYEGKSGFVTWAKLKDDDTKGFWLMFYDYKNSMVVVPTK